MDRAHLEFLARVASAPLPPQDHPDHGTLLAAQANAELARRELRQRAEESLYVFCKDVLGYRDLYEPLHRPLCDWVQVPTKQLVLVPRGHFKSTIISVSYPLWILAKYPDTRILISNATLDNPRKFVAEQLHHLRGNPVLRWVFPEMCPTKDVAEFGFVESYTVPSRKATWGEASVEITSVSNNVVSRHYEVILFDDLVSAENSSTKGGLEGVSERYRTDQALLQGVMKENTWRTVTPHVKVVGTRWHYDDLYGNLLARDYPAMVRRAVEDGEPIFPTLFSLDTLAERRKEMGSSVYASQMMNDPVDEETAIFKRANATYHDRRHGRGLSVAITVDLAISTKQTADETVVMVTGIDNQGKLFVLDYSHGRWLPDKAVKEIYRLFDAWPETRAVYVESVAYQKSFLWIMGEYAKQVQRWLPVREVRPDADKHRRITMLQPIHESHRLLIKPEMTTLEDQLYRFPKVKHDDIIDALAMRMMRSVWNQTEVADDPELPDFSIARIEKELADKEEVEGLTWFSSDFASIWPDKQD